MFYLLGDEINAICDKHKDDALCKGFGAKYWWSNGWNEQICLEEDNDDCERYRERVKLED